MPGSTRTAVGVTALLCAAAPALADAPPPPPPPARPMIGLVLGPHPKTCGAFIERIAGDSSAARNGLKPRDVILRVGDHDARGKPMADVVALLGAAPDPVRITVLRDGRELAVEVLHDSKRSPVVDGSVGESEAAQIAHDWFYQCEFDPGWTLDLDELDCTTHVVSFDPALPAGEVGFLGKDVLLRLGNIDFRDIGRDPPDYRKLARPEGGKLPVVYLRDGKEVTATMSWRGNHGHGHTVALDELLSRAWKEQQLRKGRCLGDNARLTIPEYQAKVERERLAKAEAERKKREAFDAAEKERIARETAAYIAAHSRRAPSEDEAGATPRPRVPHTGRQMLVDYALAWCGDGIYRVRWLAGGEYREDGEGHLAYGTSGCTRVFSDELEDCPICGGKGFISTGPVFTCRVCKGRGAIGGGWVGGVANIDTGRCDNPNNPASCYGVRQRLDTGNAISAVTCQSCGGRGVYGVTTTCSTCKGRGRTLTKEAQRDLGAHPY